MTALCCNLCFQNIAKKDTTAAKLWLDACAYFMKFEGVYKLRETRVPASIKYFRVLEELGFITTADGDDAVKVRVNGYEVLDVSESGLDTFCIEREQHGSEWI